LSRDRSKPNVEYGISIFVYPELTVEQVDRVASVLRAFEESHTSPKIKETVAWAML